MEGRVNLLVLSFPPLSVCFDCLFACFLEGNRELPFIMDRLRNLLSVVSNRIGRRNNETSYFCTHLRKTSASQTRNFLEEKSPMPKLNKFLFILPNLMNALEWPALGDSVRPRVSSSVHWRRKLNLPKRFGGRWRKDD